MNWKIFRKKFQYVCDTETEWVEIQEYLFTKGFMWEEGCKEVHYFGEYVYPRIIQNYRTGDRFGMKNLIISNQHWSDDSILTSSSNLLRKLKL